MMEEEWAAIGSAKCRFVSSHVSSITHWRPANDDDDVDWNYMCMNAFWARGPNLMIAAFRSAK